VNKNFTGLGASCDVVWGPRITSVLSTIHPEPHFLLPVHLTFGAMPKCDSPCLVPA